MGVVVMLMISLIVTMPSVQTLQVEQPNNQLSWAKTLKSKKQIVTNLQFYFHDTVSGKTPSAVRVAQSFYTENSPTRFGAVMMADDPLTESPDPSSKLMGFTMEALLALSANCVLHSVREMAVVGGTGLFRLARGYAVAKTHWFDPNTGDAIVGYNVTIVT
ncbi:Dirigent protein 23 [Camellia lanceoleosa]|uniref:Dirigent protein 23 n=1 Tax=Camellia lanceoleosa TaxID=1840588 RepID=A0ACC0IFP9_9ERIC|nr:Dirigent protein 23 [Camellia lanceoleosa]